MGALITSLKNGKSEHVCVFIFIFIPVFFFFLNQEIRMRDVEAGRTEWNRADYSIIAADGRCYTSCTACFCISLLGHRPRRALKRILSPHSMDGRTLCHITAPSPNATRPPCLGLGHVSSSVFRRRVESCGGDRNLPVRGPLSQGRTLRSTSRHK